ncbi:hypothetical protein C8R43DRAFT_1019331 [Mycena crocata]|nr:hypothetical protein C8R43DRAFT_1019331 [Mycena crocata]
MSYSMSFHAIEAACKAHKPNTNFEDVQDAIFKHAMLGESMYSPPWLAKKDRFIVVDAVLAKATYALSDALLDVQKLRLAANTAPVEKLSDPVRLEIAEIETSSAILWGDAEEQLSDLPAPEEEFAWQRRVVTAHTALLTKELEQTEREAIRLTERCEPLLEQLVHIDVKPKLRMKGVPWTTEERERFEADHEAFLKRGIELDKATQSAHQRVSVILKRTLGKIGSAVQRESVSRTTDEILRPRASGSTTSNNSPAGMPSRSSRIASPTLSEDAPPPKKKAKMTDA